MVEVLSPSKMDVDRWPKLDFYKSLASLRHIAFVYQDQLRVEHYRRVGDRWEIDVLTHASDTLHFESVEFQMPVVQAYFDVEL